MSDVEKCSKIEAKAFLKITDKYYMGHDKYNVIIYTKRINKAGKIVYGDCKFFPNIKTAINRVMELAEIECVGPDITEMIAKFEAIKNEVVYAMQGSNYGNLDMECTHVLKHCEAFECIECGWKTF